MSGWALDGLTLLLVGNATHIASIAVACAKAVGHGAVSPSDAGVSATRRHVQLVHSPSPYISQRLARAEGSQVRNYYVIETQAVQRYGRREEGESGDAREVAQQLPKRGPE